jgi:hypothetical protein
MCERRRLALPPLVVAEGSSALLGENSLRDNRVCLSN